MERLKLLIVDDEQMIRDGLALGFPWQAWGYDLVGTAGHGREALELVASKSPDVVLTDIRMPVMDGIALMNELDGMAFEGQVVIISGYSDIDYYKKAIEYKVFDYVLKPTSDEEVAAVFERLAAKMFRDKADREKMSRMKAMLDESIPVMKGNFLTALLDGDIKDKATVGQKLYFFNYDLTLEGYCVCTISYETTDKGQPSDVFYDEHQCAQQQYIVRYLNSALAPHVPSVFFISTHQRLLGLCDTKDVKKVKRRLTEAANDLQEKKGLYLIIGISDGSEDIEQIGCQQERANQAHLSLMIEEDSNIRIYEAAEGEGAMYFQKEVQVKEVFKQVLASEGEGPIDDIEAFFRFYKRPDKGDIDHIDTVCYMIYAEFYRAGIRYGLVTEGDDCHQFKEKVAALTRISSKKALLYEAIWALKGRLDSKRSAKDCLIIEMEAFMLRHLSDVNLSLTMMADKFNRNPAYLSAMYKKHTGMNIQDYIKTKRLSRAKVHLRTTALKIYEIAEKVGYSDPSYFNRIFRKDTGMSPIEFRKEGL